MGLISLEGMQFYAYHGMYEEEQKTGNNFVIDLYIETNFGGAAASDDISGTINYETVFFVCKSEMAKPKKLLEALGAAIINRLKHQFDTITNARIRISKLNPPLGGRVAKAVIEMESSFTNKCGRCGGGFICHGDGSCWCQNIRVHQQTLQSLRQQYSGCLCQNCLQLYTEKS